MKKFWKPGALPLGLLLSLILTGLLNTGLALLIHCRTVTMETALSLLPVIPTAAVWAGGFLTARQAKRQKLLWSLASGLCYFGILTLLHLLLFPGAYQNPVQLFALVLSMSAVAGLCGAGISREKKLSKAYRMH